MKPCQPYINQSTRKGKNKEQNGGLTSKKTNEITQEGEPQGNIKFLNPLHSPEACQIRKGEGRHFSSSKQSILFM
jgi:hypothetical protein